MRRLLILLLIIVPAGGIQAQLSTRLQALGMENIRTAETDGTAFVSFENNTYRGTYRGIGKAVEAVMQDSLTTYKDIQLIITDNGIPQLCISLPEALITDYRTGRIGLREVYARMKLSYDTEEVTRRLQHTPEQNASVWKVDIVLYPELTLQNFTFDKLYSYELNFAPAAQWTLWKGGMLTAQVVIPLSTNKKGEAERIRPGVIALSQEARLGKHFFGRVAAGNFTDNRFGVQAEMAYRPTNGRWQLDAAVGSTSYSGVPDDEGWYISTRQRINASVGGSVFVPKLNMELAVHANRYIYGDMGVRGDCTHHFGEYAIGIYGMVVEGELNGGFHFAIPLPGKKRNHRHRVNVRLPEYYAAEYSMEPWGRYIDQRMGRTYHTRPDENRSQRLYQPDFVRYYLLKEYTGQ